MYPIHLCDDGKKTSNSIRNSLDCSSIHIFFTPFNNQNPSNNLFSRFRTIDWQSSSPKAFVSNELSTQISSLCISLRGFVRRRRRHMMMPISINAMVQPYIDIYIYSMCWVRVCCVLTYTPILAINCYQFNQNF